MVPILTKLFASHDRGIRRGLLENIAAYGPSLPDRLVEEQVPGGAGAGLMGGPRGARTPPAHSHAPAGRPAC